MTIQTLDVLASELRQGDIVLCHGMRVLLDRPISSRTRGTKPYNTVYWCNGLVLNIDELSDEWLIGATREYQPWPNRHKPTGEHRWQVQSNDLLTWRVERQA